MGVDGKIHTGDGSCLHLATSKTHVGQGDATAGGGPGGVNKASPARLLVVVLSPCFGLLLFLACRSTTARTARLLLWVVSLVWTNQRSVLVLAAYSPAALLPVRATS